MEDTKVTAERVNKWQVKAHQIDLVKFRYFRKDGRGTDGKVEITKRRDIQIALGNGNLFIEATGKRVKKGVPYYVAHPRKD